MCGIAGFVDFGSARDKAANDRLARAMGDAIRHRGPDSGAIWSSPAGVWLSFRRLAILDLSEAGDQPMLTPDGRGAICFNGEAYEAPAAKPELERAGYSFRGHSDTEVLLYACHRYGPIEAARRIAGMYAFAYWDEAERTLTLIRDRLGKKPLYWFQTSRGLAFASEIRSLLQHPDCPTELDRSSVADLLRFHYIPAPFSIFEGVHKLEPGSALTLHVPSGRITTGRYWDLRQRAHDAAANPFAGTPEEAVEETERLLLDATRLRLLSDVPLGAFLSGGIDSSTVTALMGEAGSGPPRTFSIGYSDAEYDEGADAALVAAHLGTDHTGFIVEPEDALQVIPDLPAIFDEPFADASQVPTYLVSKLARKHVTVALTGDGGDEVFGGYNRHVAANGLLRRLNGLPRPMRTAMSGAMSALPPETWQRMLRVVPSRVRPRAVGEKMHKLAPLLRLAENDQYRSLVSHWDTPEDFVRGSSARPTAIDDPALERDFPEPVARMRYLDLATYLPGDILTKVDRASMGVSLETRAPLLDHRLVEWSFRLPTSVHLHDGRGKWLLRQILEKRVPRALFERPKTGFGIPIGDWLRGPLRPWAEDLLRSERLRDIVDTAPVEALWRRHLARQANGQYRIWPVLMLSAWLETYATRVRAEAPTPRAVATA